MIIIKRFDSRHSAYAAKLISTYHDLQIWSTSKCIGIAVKDKIYIEHIYDCFYNA